MNKIRIADAIASVYNGGKAFLWIKPVFCCKNGLMRKLANGMNIKGLVLDIDRFSTHDGAGIRTAVFLKGCPISCKWCHSPESQYPKPELIYRKARCTGCGACIASCPEDFIIQENIDEIAEIRIIDGKNPLSFVCAEACKYQALQIAGMEWDAGDLVQTFRDDIVFFDTSKGGITISGGEPLMQFDFTFKLLSLCKEMEIHTILETCGYGNKNNLRELAGISSMIFYDIKHMDAKLHNHWTGVSNELILANLQYLCSDPDTTQKIKIRIPCIPDINDNPENIVKTAEFAKELGIDKMQLLPYNPIAEEKYNWIGQQYSLSEKQPGEKAYYEYLEQIVRDMGLKTE